MRILLAAFFLFLAGCATTGVDTAPVEAEEPVIAAEPENVPSSTATIDEHLFIPEEPVDDSIIEKGNDDDDGESDTDSNDRFRLEAGVVGPIFSHRLTSQKYHLELQLRSDHRADRDR